jgi:hypothetical protein
VRTKMSGATALKGERGEMRGMLWRMAQIKK